MERVAGTRCARQYEKQQYEVRGAAPDGLQPTTASPAAKHTTLVHSQKEHQRRRVWRAVPRARVALPPCLRSLVSRSHEQPLSRALARHRAPLHPIAAGASARCVRCRGG
eukprot:6188110-Pleurochrysis_carterae.AAC.2